MKNSAMAYAVLVCLAISLPARAEYGGGGGWTPEDPFLISEPAHLLAIGANPAHWDKFFRLTNDIDLSGLTWSAGNIIGMTTAFTGTFDGDGHAIRNLSYTTAAGNFVGLFGRINSGTVKNLGLVNVTLEVTAAANTGGLVGQIVGGRLENCYAVYAITTCGSAQFVGGLAGQAAMSIISGCQSRGQLTVGPGSHEIGGLVGISTASILNSYSSGTITAGNASQTIGGLVGEHHGEAGPIDGCYSTCSIGGGGSLNNIGGLIGEHTQGHISDCYSTGSVQAAFYAGGLTGSSVITTYGTISDCHSSSDVVVTSHQAGGLVGYGEGVTITGSDSSGSVSGQDNAQSLGGLVGSIWGGSSLSNCSSTSSVTGGVNANTLGGLAGLAANSTVSGCYSSGAVTSGGGTDARLIGGLIGMHGSGSITNCYSVSAVTGSNIIGGLVGQIAGVSVTNCFAAGAVNSEGALAGGLIGELMTATPTPIGCYWDKDTSGKLTSGGGKGLTTEAMRLQSTFTAAGWDFVSTWKMYDYPGLMWQPEIGTSGDLSASLSSGQQQTLSFSVFSLRAMTIGWTLSGYDTCGWITSAAPVSGSSIGPADAATVALTIDAAGLEAGDYSHNLLLAGDNGETVELTIHLRVFQRVKLDTFAALASHWGQTSCDFGQPCKTVDWYIDGTIDIKDLAQLVDGWLGEEISSIKATLPEGFESGDFSYLNWQHGGQASWTIVPEAHEGGFAAKSGPITDGQESTLEFTVDLTGWQIDTLSFACKVSSESGYDCLRLYVDGLPKGAWSGLWTDYSILTVLDITPGLRTFRWVYSKDGSDLAGDDCAWIDNIRIYAR